MQLSYMRHKKKMCNFLICDTKRKYAIKFYAAQKENIQSYASQKENIQLNYMRHKKKIRN